MSDACREAKRPVQVVVLNCEGKFQGCLRATPPRASHGPRPPRLSSRLTALGTIRSASRKRKKSFLLLLLLSSSTISPWHWNTSHRTPLPTIMEESTRVFVSGLPPSFSNDQLRKHFATRFQVTDAHVLPKRRIGFVGFKSPDVAKEAARYFNKTYMKMSKISVEIAKPVCDLTLTFLSCFSFSSCSLSSLLPVVHADR